MPRWWPEQFCAASPAPWARHSRRIGRRLSLRTAISVDLLGFLITHMGAESNRAPCADFLWSWKWHTNLLVKSIAKLSSFVSRLRPIWFEICLEMVRTGTLSQIPVSAALRDRDAWDAIRERGGESLTMWLSGSGIDLGLRHMLCGRRYLEPATGVAKKGWTGCPFRHHRPRGDEGDSCKRRLGYEEPDAGQA